MDDADAASELEDNLYDELADALDDLAYDVGSLLAGSDAHDVHDAGGPAEGGSDDESEPAPVARKVADVLPAGQLPLRSPVLAGTGIGAAQRGVAPALVRGKGEPIRSTVGAALGQAEAAVSRARATTTRTSRTTSRKGPGRGKKR